MFGMFECQLVVFNLTLDGTKSHWGNPCSFCFNSNTSRNLNLRWSIPSCSPIILMLRWRRVEEGTSRSFLQNLRLWGESTLRDDRLEKRLRWSKREVETVGSHKTFRFEANSSSDFEVLLMWTTDGLCRLICLKSVKELNVERNPANKRLKLWEGKGETWLRGIEEWLLIFEGSAWVRLHLLDLSLLFLVSPPRFEVSKLGPWEH